MSKYLLLTAPKAEGQTKAKVRQAAASAQPGYRVASIADKGTEWEVRLEQLATDKVSNRKRQAAPPPEFLKDKGDSEEAPEGSPEEEASESPEEEAEEKSDTDKDEGKSEDDKDKSKDQSKDEDPVKAIEGIMADLNKLLGDLGGHAQKLKEKADKVDEVHELTKGPNLVDDMGEVPPVPPIDDAAAIGPTPGGPPGAVPPTPGPPRRPPVPTGRSGKPGVRPPVGVPTFTKKKTKIVEHPIQDDDGAYSIADFLAAVAVDPQCEGYIVAEVKTLKEANVYAGKLELAE